MKKKGNILTAILFFSGLSVLLYPYISNMYNTFQQKQLIANYNQSVSLDKEQKEVLREEIIKAYRFNEKLLPMILPDSFVEADLVKEDEEYMSCLNLNGDGIMGIIEIPKINVCLPVNHTTREEVLKVGAGHLHGSSLPVGGINTHAVISAHRGLPTATLFTDLNLLEEGDYFGLKILGKNLYYEVDQIKVVVPEDTKDLNVVEGKDLVTLLTCTPYGVNSKRLLVRGHRVFISEDTFQEKKDSAGFSIFTNYAIWIFGALFLTVLLAVVLWMRERKDRKRIK